MTNNKTAAILSVTILIILTLLFFWKILLTNLILSGVDVFLYFYPYKAYAAEALRQGRLPLWNPHLFMGVPLLANSQVGLFYPLNWPFIWLDAPRQISWSIGLHVALAGIFMLMFGRVSLKLGWPAALMAAILFAFGGYLGAQVEHINQLQAAAWLPLLFLLYSLGMRRHSRQRRWFWFLLMAPVVALVLFAGHAQTAFIALFGLGLYGLWQALFESVNWQISQAATKISAARVMRHMLHVIPTLMRYLLPPAIISVLAVAIAAVQLIPTAELSGLSIRNEGLTFREVVSFSLRPTVLHYSLLPPLGLDLTQILGQAFSEWVAYLGISGLILAMTGSLTAIWQPAPRRFIFLSAGGLVLSLGLYTGPLYLALYHLVPGFDLFRVPARWLLLYGFGMSILAGFGFQSLFTPGTTRKQLASMWDWFNKRRWHWVIPGLPVIFFAVLVAWKTPPLTTLVIWLTLTAVTISLIYYTMRLPHHASYAGQIAIALLVIAELLGAAQTLNYNQPTAPQAYHSMRNSTAFLLAADSPYGNTPPGRFLSLSGITYDPGDLHDLQQIFGTHLSEQAIYNLIVATKEKEVLFFNLPMIYNLHSVDGYDGGILPLKQFITFQKLFLPEDNLSQDGRLREKLQYVPANWLLSLINARWIITDKQFDAWIDGIFYDLQFPARLSSKQTISTTDIPHFTSTAIGLVSHLEKAADLPTASPVAEVTVQFSNGEQDNFILKAGEDTAEGIYSDAVAHLQATVGVTWPYKQDGVDYISIKPLTTSQQIKQISIRALLPDGQFNVQGISLIHQPTTTSRSVILSTESDYRQVHSGDVKVYENREILPRAFIVHQTEIVADETEAVKTMKLAEFKASQTMVRLAHKNETPATISLGKASAGDSASITRYTPERIEITTQTETPGWLVLTDTYYPGWHVTIDEQPAKILQTNILFRAVEIPEGEHRVVFEFRPRSLQTGGIISIIALFGVAVGLVVAGRRR